MNRIWGGGQSADGAPVLGMKASHCVLLTKDPFHMKGSDSVA